MKIYINDAGLEQLAKGEIPYYWDFLVRHDVGETPKIAYLVAENVEVTLPSRETAARIAVTALREKKQQIYAEAAQEAQKVEERIQNMLALEGPSS